MATQPTGGGLLNRPSSPPPTAGDIGSPQASGHAGGRFRPRFIAPDARASAWRYQPRSEPEQSDAPVVPGAQREMPPTGGVLATTQDTGTSFSPAVQGHPREREIRAHEAAHQAQFAARDRRPVGETPQLEAEARDGARRVMKGEAFDPQLAAPVDAALFFEFASAGDHLDRFQAWLVENSNYDVDAVDWSTVVTDMLYSNRIYSTTAGDDETAIDLSDRYRYLMLLQIFDQELDAAEPVEPVAAAAGSLVVPTTEQLEDTLFDGYLPTLTADDFALSDVEASSDAFLDHWLTNLGALNFIPDTFDLTAFQPEPRTQEFEDERLRILDAWFDENIQNEMFMFMLDEFARAIGGSAATVTGLPPLLGGGEQRSLSAQHWLETLDMETYRAHLIQHIVDKVYAVVGKDADFAHLMRTAAEERSRFSSLAVVHGLIWLQKKAVADTIKSLREDTLDELDDFDWEVATAPALAYERMSKVADATSAFYRDIGPARNNDEALAKVLEGLAAALADVKGLGPTWAFALRLSTALTAYKNEIETQRQRIRDDIAARVEVSYDDIAAGIKEMGQFAADYINETWIPKLHEVALARITANVELLRDRYEHWDEYSKTDVASLEARATVFEDIAQGLRIGEYERVELGSESIEAADADRLDDVAAIMRAEAKRLKDPSEAKKGKSKLKEALDGFEDVKARIEAREEDPTVYGDEVKQQAMRELGLDTFPPYTTYGDIIFGRVSATRNPFLARLVIAYDMVAKLDRSLKGITILAGLGLLSIASLLAAPFVALGAGLLGASAATEAALAGAAGTVLFAIDAIVALGLAVHDVTEAQALLKLVRLDLDHTVTGVSEEDAERALTMAWVGLALNVLVLAGAAGIGIYLKFFRGGTQTAGLSLKYYQLLRENPELFNSLRAVYKDANQFDRILGLAGDAAELQKLVHRMDATLDLGRIERLIAFTGDAGKAGRMLDITGDAQALEAALSELKFFTGTDEAVFQNLLASSDDVSLVLNVLNRSEDLPAAQALIESIPDVTRLSSMLDLAQNAATLRGIRAIVGDLDRVEMLLQAVGAGGGPRLLRVLEMPQAAGLADEAVTAIARLDATAIDAIAVGDAADVADIAALVRKDGPKMNTLFGTHGGAVMEHVSMAPYATVDDLEKALATAAKRVDVPKGIFAETATVPAGWTFDTTRVPDPVSGAMVLPTESDGTIVIETTITAPGGQRGYFERAYNPITNQFELRNAFLQDLPPWVPQATPMVAGRGTPTVTFVTLHQMQELGATYGGIQKFKMSTIQNIDAIMHLQWLRNRYPATALDALVAETHSVRYAESTIIQSGHRIAGVSLDDGGAATTPIKRLLEHFEAQAAARGPAAYTAKVAEHQALLDRYGFTRDTPMMWNYNIYINVVPF